MNIIFQICCGIIRVLSYIFGTTYEEMNTYLFIYVEPAILIISFAIVIISFKQFKKFSIFKFTLLGLFGIGGLVYTLATLAVWKRYVALSAHNTCILAYKDLETLGRLTGMGYVGINLFLFIILFLTILVFNITSVLLIKKYAKSNIATY